MSDQPESTTDLSPAATPVEPTHATSERNDAADAPAAVDAPSGGASEASEAGGPDDAGEPSDDAGGEGEGEGGEGAAVEGATGEGKKRRRRRRKKKTGDGTEGPRPEGAPEGARAEGGRPDKHREPRNDLPLSRFLDPHGARKSPFTAGDVVGGRVIALQAGVAVIDLFGHGIAFAHSNEPRSLPVAPEEPEEVEAPAEAHAEGGEAQPDASAIGTAAAELDGQVGMPAAESIAPPPPMTAGAVSVPVIAEEAPPVESNPTLVGRAARALRRVGTPTHTPGQADDEETQVASGTSSGSEEAPASDAESEDPELTLGEIFRGRVASVAESGTMAISNRSIIRADARARLAKAREEHRRVFGMVFGYNRGGFDVLVEGMRAFCPVSGMTLAHLENADDLVGQRLEFSVQAAKGGHQGIVVSRRSILEREARKRGKELRKSLRVGQRLKGRVTQVREFGVFVDLGGIEGLVHMSEVSWDRSVRPEQAATVGDEVDVEILRIGGEAPPPRGRGGRDRAREGAEGDAPSGRADRREDRRMSERVALSMKAAQPDPWHTKLEGLAEGTAHKGKITRTTEFGAFVELVPGIEGLLHITELGRELRHANERVKEGEDIFVVIERIDIKGHRISLSRMSPEDAKAFAEGTLEAAASGRVLKPGTHLKVKVERIEVVGLHVQVEGVIGRRGRGFIPNAEMGTERGTDHRRKFPVGTEVDVKVIGIDRDGGLRLSRKGFAQDEERRAIQDYRREASQKGFGTFGDILKSKLQSKS